MPTYTTATKVRDMAKLYHVEYFTPVNGTLDISLAANKAIVGVYKLTKNGTELTQIYTGSPTGSQFIFTVKVDVPTITLGTAANGTDRFVSTSMITFTDDQINTFIDAWEAEINAALALSYTPAQLATSPRISNLTAEGAASYCFRSSFFNQAPEEIPYSDRMAQQVRDAIERLANNKKEKLLDTTNAIIPRQNTRRMKTAAVTNDMTITVYAGDNNA